MHYALAAVESCRVTQFPAVADYPAWNRSLVLLLPMKPLLQLGFRCLQFDLWPVWFSGAHGLIDPSAVQAIEH